jgi:hypothetical protein
MIKLRNVLKIFFLALLSVPLILLSCTTAEITLDSPAVKSLKVIALVPFKFSSRADNLKVEIYNEAEQSFTSALIRLNYKIIPKDQIGIDSFEKRIISSGAVNEDVLQTAATAGADAILIGDIILNEEVVRYIHPRKTIFFGGTRFRDRNDEIKTQTTYKFQIEVKLVDTSNDSVILSLKNRYSDAEKDEYLPGYLSLDAYRAHILKKLSDEMADKLNSAD